MAHVVFAIVEPFADWEPALLAAGAHGFLNDSVRWLSPGGQPVHSMGGLSVQVDGAIEDFDASNADALVAIGSPLWQTEQSPDISSALRNAAGAGIVVAGICGATLALARAGLLDDRAHTSNSLEFLTTYAAGYRGQSRYRAVPQAVCDRNVVTAAGTAPVSFAIEILRLLHPEAAPKLAELQADWGREHLAR